MRARKINYVMLRMRRFLSQKKTILSIICGDLCATTQKDKMSGSARKRKLDIDGSGSDVRAKNRYCA